MNYKKVLIYFVISLSLMAIVLNLFLKKEDFYVSYPSASLYNDLTTDLSDFTIMVEEEFPLIEIDYGTTTYADKQILVDEDFKTQLPLVVIDVGSDYIKKAYYWDEEKGALIAIEGVDPNSYGTISIIDNIDGVNGVTDDATLISDSLISLRGNTSQGYDKKQYKVVLTDTSYNNKDMQVLDIGYGHEWVLNGAFSDSSMMRNYLSYTMAGAVIENTPDTKYVEVVIKTDIGYQYHGVYLLMESVERSEDRLDIEKYSSNSLSHATFIMKRDRFTEDGIILENYSKVNDLAYGYIEVLYPNDLKTYDIDLLTTKVNNFEEVLYSNDPEVFKGYRDLINVETFIDYFIVNELFMNYDAGFNSTYFYSDSTGKISMGPVWDFDLALDNDRFVKGDFESTAFHEAPWFDRLLLDSWFTTELIKRYEELRSGQFSDEVFLNLVESTVSHLGSSIDREWSRWGYYYRANLYNEFEYDSQFGAPTVSYDEEVSKVVTAYLSHSNWLDEEFDSLYQFSNDDYNTTKITDIDWGTVFGYTFITLWIVSVIILQRRMS